MKFRSLSLLVLIIISTLFSCHKKEEEFIAYKSKEERQNALENDRKPPGSQPNPACQEGQIIYNNSAIEGYIDKQTYYPEDQVIFYIHSQEPLYSFELFRVGQNLDLIEKIDKDNGVVQNYLCYSYSSGCNWNKSINYKLNNVLKSGLYAAKISNVDGHFWITFIVKPPSKKSDIALIASTNTWAAYNDWGGASFYTHRIEPAVTISENINFRRPNPYLDPTTQDNYLAGAERFLISWLEKNQYSVDHFTDRDLHEIANTIQSYKVIMLQCHPEYYTEYMYTALYRYVNRGGHLMMMGANGIYAKVVLNPINEVLELRLTGNNHSYEKSKGGRWRDLGYPESELLGTEYTRTGYNTYHPYRVLNEDHWIFKNTGLKNGETFGSTCSKVAGASGLETDKRTKSSPKNLDFLAKGTNPDFGGAEMIYYTTPENGKIFSVGSITYTVCLEDQHISQITKNVLDEFLK